MLSKLVIQDNKFHCNQHIIIVVFKSTDETAKILSISGIEFYFLFRSFKDFVNTCFRIYKFKPNVIQSWLYISDLISLLFKIFYPKSKLVWNIRNGQPVKEMISKYSWFSAIICSKFSFIPSKIICPSKTSIEKHIEFGYCKSKFIYIPNFIDPLYSESSFSIIDKYYKKEIITFGVVTRFDGQKGIDTLLKSIYQLPPGLNIQFHFIGTGMTKGNIESKLLSMGILSLQYEFICFEKKEDLIEFYTNIDFHISPSRSEAFPNAVFESMFMGKPNIATNAGDSIYLISDIGTLVNVNDHESIAKSIIKYVNLYNCNFQDYLNLSSRSHQWIRTSFDLNEVLNEYNKVWEN